MNIRFLLGPAGSGKTWQCVAEIRQELLQRPAGPPLIFLAPRQATFQLERQLLADAALAGYSRLFIFSFARLANYILHLSGAGKPRLLSEEGRVMVLRALLHQRAAQLKIFHASARLPGFARELSRWLRELQQQQIKPEHLEKAAQALNSQPDLSAKLQDTARLYQSFEQWLQDQALADADGLLPLAAARLRQAAKLGQPLHIAGLWMDGFAELTPQEVDFLAALAFHCQKMTLAFCVDGLVSEELPVFHPQAGVARTVRRCAEVLSGLPGVNVTYATLNRDSGHSRFANAPALAHLERHWSALSPPAYPQSTPEVRLAGCANPEAEVILAAREILRHVQSGGRFREVAVMVRRLETHASLLKRIFRQYQIPFFLDQRESMAHHPLAELTRYALRVVAHGWQNSDWLGALKTGLAPIQPEALDELENLALERGLDGEIWTRSWSGQSPPAPYWEPARARLVAPFAALKQALQVQAGGVTGGMIASGLRQFYDALKVADTLKEWAESKEFTDDDLPAAAHATVWQAVEDWLDTLEQALNDYELPLPEWLPILESGLSQLSVGIIPPAMDQVLVGAVDRSRQPELHTLIILGMNETLFPAAPTLPPLLSEDERARLEQECALKLGQGAMTQLGAERYLGYIACTRSASRLLVTRAEAQADGKPLNPSLFYLRLQQMFPHVQEENFSGRLGPAESVHWSELLPALVAAPEAPPELLQLAPPQVQQLRGYAKDERLSPQAVEQLMGANLRTSISALETYAACPFRYFVERLLRACERQEFAADELRCGSFMHEVMAKFHQSIKEQSRRWRDLSPDEARQLLRNVADEVSDSFHYGVMRANARHQFRRELLVQRLEDYVAQAVQWMQHYQLDPCLVEMGFGLKNEEGGNALPSWKISLDNGRTLELIGRIDRLDLYPKNPGEPALAVVVDYKSREKKLDILDLYHGLELQLFAYVNVAGTLQELAQTVGAGSIQPIGAFYVSFTASVKRANTRKDAYKEESKESPFPHQGRFIGEHWKLLDASADSDPKRGPIAFRIRKLDGIPYGTMVLDEAGFNALLEQNLQHLRAFGQRIFQGDMQVAPYKKSNGQKSACDHCPCAGVCRIEPWRDSFRILAKPPEPSRQSARTAGA